MLLFFFCLCCALQPLFHYMSVFGKKEPAKRFIDEVGMKPPIFGSYCYDPIKGVFEISDGNGTQSLSHAQIINASYILSTAVGDEVTTMGNNVSTISASRYFRLRASVTPKKQTNWWERANVNSTVNSTVKERRF